MFLRPSRKYFLHFWPRNWHIISDKLSLDYNKSKNIRFKTMILSDFVLESTIYASSKFGMDTQNPSIKISVKVISNKNMIFFRPSRSVRHVSLFMGIFLKRSALEHTFSSQAINWTCRNISSTTLGFYDLPEKDYAVLTIKWASLFRKAKFEFQ